MVCDYHYRNSRVRHRKLMNPLYYHPIRYSLSMLRLVKTFHKKLFRMVFLSQFVGYIPENKKEHRGNIKKHKGGTCGLQLPAEKRGIWEHILEHVPCYCNIAYTSNNLMQIVA